MFLPHPDDKLIDDPVEAVRELIRRRRRGIELFGDDPRNQRWIDEAWQAWREHLPADLLPPKRPIIGSNKQQAHDALDELLRELNRLFPSPSAQQETGGAGSDPAKGAQGEETSQH